jgi:hypothetical protein
LKAVEDAKAMQIDTEDPTKTIQIKTGLHPVHHQADEKSA